MVTVVRTERGPDGLEVVKEADSDEGRARLHHEAEMLTRAKHPGVVEAISSAPSVLRLRHRGTALSRLGALPPDHVAAIVRSVAEVVDALHRLGIAHTRIGADHVVVGDRGRPRLCGLAEATEATDELRAADVADLGRLLDELLDASGDALWSPVHRGVRHAGRRRKAVAGFRRAASAARRDDPGQRPSPRQFAASLHDALPDLALPLIPGDGAGREFASIPADVDPTADLSWTDDDLSFLTADDDDHEGGDPFAKLAALSEGRSGPSDDEDDGGDEDDPVPGDGAGPRTAPSVTDVERAFGAVTFEPDGSIDPLPPVRIRPSAISRESPEPATTSRRALVVIAVVVLVLGAVAGAVIARAVQPFDSAASTSPRTSTTASPGATDPAGDVVRSQDTVPPAPPPHPAGCTVSDQPGPDLDGDGCPESVSLDGRVASVGDRAVELGRPGDLAVLADHDCDGVATPVLLRPSSGEVFVFTGWSLDEPTQVEAATVVPRAAAIETTAGACPAVVVSDSSGAEHIVAGPSFR